MKPGIYEIPSAAYHADPCDRPSLSASVAHTLIERSPLHAYWQHPKLNADWQPPSSKDDQKYAVGTAAHALLLEGRKAVEVFGYTDWRTQEARELRDAAHAAGKVPLLERDWQAVQDMVEAVKQQALAINAVPPLFRDGQAEATITWQDNGVLCRCRIDHLHNDFTACDDLKTTAKSANPDAYSRALYQVGGDIQAAMNIRAVRAVTGVEPVFRWIIVENTPPYAMSVVSPDPAVLEIANAKVDRALEIWQECLKTGRWPGYPQQVCYAELPPWEESRWLEREAREAA